MEAALRETLSRVLGERCELHVLRPVSGGCIHRCYAIETSEGPYFLKLSDPAHGPTLIAEADGLQALHAAGMRVPSVIAQGEVGDQRFLLLEYLDLVRSTAASQWALGRSLAQLHTHALADRYGWHTSNFIGLTPQANAWHEDWTAFWLSQRLRPQLKRAAANGHTGSLQTLGERFMEALPALLGGHRPPAALLHGDLWGGNAGTLADGSPVIFDPAAYYGDPEADLAMTELFGGFRPEFYAGYREVRAIDPGYAVRKHVYNLYHVLNHLNLFGGGYRQQAEQLMRRLLAEVR
ncbi:MAG: fructosamine kinase family protein [Pseudomonadota bacterium]|nr:MAG: hypothetical protein DIU74_11530 [Pseudomonadota bacterium]